MVTLASRRTVVSAVLAAASSASCEQALIAPTQGAWSTNTPESQGMDTQQITMLDTNAEAIELLSGLMRAGDNVLIKGSRGATMEVIVAALQQQPEQRVTSNE